MEKQTPKEKQQQRLLKRNEAVKKSFNEIQDKNPKWKTEAVISSVADKFFLAERTISAIITNEGIYGGIDLFK